MARPNDPAHHRKARVISFRVTFSEAARLEFNAAAQACSVNRYARDLALDTTRNPRLEIHTRLDPSFVAQVQRIGHNLNQLCKNAHIFGRVSPQVETLCIRISKLIDQAIGEG